ncbi:hypothetical protein QIS74_02960 [Colletotrichum tabaci]|uniref:Uncharacterized protein n=1 Tax=Colletotrichum tabaci TaxID=1209068 RepID=A0AAV9TMF9_9PEZI
MRLKRERRKFVHVTEPSSQLLIEAANGQGHFISSPDGALRLGKEMDGLRPPRSTR